MPEPPIELRLLSGRARSGYSVALAGGRLLSDCQLSLLSVPAPAPRRHRMPSQARWHTDYRGPGLVEGRAQEVHAESARSWRRVTFEDGERFVVSVAGWIARDPGLPEAGPSSLERALGAPMALALAARGIYLLHASAIEVGGDVVAFIGEPGAGKSTLAAYAVQQGLARLADDQLAVRLGSAPLALPHFPQLKLRAEECYPEQARAERRLRALVSFRHGPALRRTDLRRLSDTAGCVEMIRATVAARIFGERDAVVHLDACASAVATLPVYALDFPSGPAGLRSALSALSELP